MNRAPLAVYPDRSSPLGLRSLLRNFGALLGSLLRPPAAVERNFSPGNERVVLVIPAFLSGDWATARLRRFLSDLGYRVETANIRLNLGPTTRLVAKLDRALLRLSDAGPIDIVGQSLGGVLARDLTLRHPDHVRRAITLCSPICVPITTPLAPAVRLLAPFYDAAWLARRSTIAGSLGVPVIALYSKEDGVVDWRECLQQEHPGCENVRVQGAHATIASSPSALAAIALALSS